MSKETFGTKWGHVAYSYEDYKKLKRLNCIFHKARMQASRWERWVRKAPHNRVERQWTRNELGQKTGHKVVGPLAEPKVCDLFFTKLVDVDRKPLTRWFEGYIRLKEIGNTVAVEYQKSHRPMSTPEKVPESQISSLNIDELLKKAEKWMEDQNG